MSKWQYFGLLITIIAIGVGLDSRMKEIAGYLERIRDKLYEK